MTSKDELWAFICSISIHHSFFELSFVLVTIYILDIAVSFLLVELEFSLIGVLVLYCQYALAMVHEIFKLSFVDLFILFIEGCHTSLYDTVL